MSPITIYDCHENKIDAVMINGRIYLPGSYTKSIPYVVLEMVIVPQNNNQIYIRGNCTIPMTQIAGVESVDAVIKAFTECYKHIEW